MALTKTQVSKLYVAVFGRASEGEGNSYWQKQAGNISSIANKMLATQAAKDYFGTTLNNNQSFIEFIYKNTLNKTYEQDPNGIKYWTSLLDKGTSKGDVVKMMIEAIDSYAPGGKNYNANDTITQKAYNQFINRVEVSNYTADKVTKAPSDYTKSMSFNKDLVVTDSKTTLQNAKTNVDKISSSSSSNTGSTTKPAIYVESKVSTDEGNDGTIDWVTNYTYKFENGVLNQYSNGELEAQYVYDSKGNMIEERSISDGDVYSTTYYTYNSNNQLATMKDNGEYYDINANFAWSSNGVVATGSLSYGGESISYKTVGTGLNAQKNAPLQSIVYLDGEKESISYYTYDSKGNETKMLEDEDANGTIDYAYYTDWILL